MRIAQAVDFSVSVDFLNIPSSWAFLQGKWRTSIRHDSVEHPSVSSRTFWRLMSWEHLSHLKLPYQHLLCDSLPDLLHFVLLNRFSPWFILQAHLLYCSFTVVPQFWVGLDEEIFLGKILQLEAKKRPQITFLINPFTAERSCIKCLELKQHPSWRWLNFLRMTDLNDFWEEEPHSCGKLCPHPEIPILDRLNSRWCEWLDQLMSPPVFFNSKTSEVKISMCS